MIQFSDSIEEKMYFCGSGTREMFFAQHTTIYSKRDRGSHLQLALGNSLLSRNR